MWWGEQGEDMVENRDPVHQDLLGTREATHTLKPVPCPSQVSLPSPAGLLDSLEPTGM